MSRRKNVISVIPGLCDVMNAILLSAETDIASMTRSFVFLRNVFLTELGRAAMHVTGKSWIKNFFIRFPDSAPINKISPSTFPIESIVPSTFIDIAEIGQFETQ